LSRYEYQMSGWVIGGVSASPGWTVASTLVPRFQRDVFGAPFAGLPHSYGVGVASSGLVLLKSQR
jgi:hypothetical protein